MAGPGGVPGSPLGYNAASDQAESWRHIARS